MHYKLKVFRLEFSDSIFRQIIFRDSDSAATSAIKKTQHGSKQIRGI